MTSDSYPCAYRAVSPDPMSQDCDLLGRASPGSDTSSNDGYANSQSSCGGGSQPSKQTDRRSKNRESAARSRERIKSKLYGLEHNIYKVKEEKDKFSNHKQLIICELEQLEGNILEVSMAKFNSLKDENGNLFD